MMQNYKIVTLCGSTRFKQQFMEAWGFLSGWWILSL